MIPYVHLIAAGVAALALVGATVKTTQMVIDGHYRREHETCGKDLPKGTYDRCPVQISDALKGMDLDRVNTVIEYRDRIITVQDKTAALQAAQIKELQADISALQAMPDETTRISSPYIDTVRRQLCDLAGDCPTGGADQDQRLSLRPRSIPGDVP
jgi:hypothetical protein